jgi:hypothetical protein
LTCCYGIGQSGSWYLKLLYLASMIKIKDIVQIPILQLRKRKRSWLSHSGTYYLFQLLKNHNFLQDFWILTGYFGFNLSGCLFWSCWFHEWLVEILFRSSCSDVFEEYSVCTVFPSVNGEGKLEVLAVGRHLYLWLCEWLSHGTCFLIFFQGIWLVIAWRGSFSWGNREDCFINCSCLT